MRNWSPFTFILFAALIALAVGGNIPGTHDPLTPGGRSHFDFSDPEEAASQEATLNIEGDPYLSAAREQHILYGDESGGGHHHSSNRPCKTEFPEDWDEAKIIEIVKQLAANDNAPWRLEDNGYYVAEQNFEELEIRVVLDEQGDDIITAYPVNLPRNACNR